MQIGLLNDNFPEIQTSEFRLKRYLVIVQPSGLKLVLFNLKNENIPKKYFSRKIGYN